VTSWPNWPPFSNNILLILDLAEQILPLGRRQCVPRSKFAEIVQTGMGERQQPSPGMSPVVAPQAEGPGEQYASRCSSIPPENRLASDTYGDEPPDEE
jgi:hypothetical protein